MGQHIENFIACPDRYPAVSAHSARRAGENAAESTAGAGNGSGRDTGITDKLCCASDKSAAQHNMMRTVA